MTSGVPPRDTSTLLDQNRLLMEEIQRRVSQLAAINAVASAVSRSLDLDQTLKTALEAVLGVVTVEATAISLVDEDTGELVLRAQQGLKLDFVSEPMRIPLGEGLSGRVVTEDRVIVTGDPSGDRRLAVPSFIQEQIKAQALVPMHARDRVIGVLSVMSHETYEFSDVEIAVLRAIADQVGIALENARLYDQVLQQQHRLSTIIQSADDAIIVTDSFGHIELLNAAAERLIITSPDKAIGMPLYNAPLLDTLRDKLRRVMNQTDAAPTVFEVSLTGDQTLTGIVSRLRSSSQVVQSEESEGWVVVLRDVTHLKRAEQLRLEFAQTAAHDLRNPLGVTLSALVMLKEFIDPADESANEIFEIATDAVNRMNSLLEDLLNLEQVDSGVDFELVLMDPRPMIEHVYTEMGPTMVGKGLVYDLDIADSFSHVKLSPNWFYRAISNYLNNASKYATSGSKITLRAFESNDELVIEVEDDGPGIPADVQSRVFDRFFRGKSKSTARGSGLGLAIVKSIAEAHQGRVYVRSQIGEGSTFGFALPLAR